MTMHAHEPATAVTHRGGRRRLVLGAAGAGTLA